MVSLALSSGAAVVSTEVSSGASVAAVVASGDVVSAAGAESTPPTDSSSFLSEHAAAISTVLTKATPITRPRDRLERCVARTVGSPLHWKWFCCPVGPHHTCRASVTPVTERERQ